MLHSKIFSCVFALIFGISLSFCRFVRYFLPAIRTLSLATIFFCMLITVFSSSKAEATSACVPLAGHAIPHVNMTRVRNVWLSWVNAERATVKLQPYVLNDELNHTASLWSRYGRQRGFIDHKRTPTSGYYDYSEIQDWFSKKGLTFANINRMTFTENVGWGPYDCTKGNCTTKLLKAIHTTLAFYLGEKGKTPDPHYASIVNSRFAQIGLGIDVDPSTKKYFLTVHYATAITSNPTAICKENLSDNH